VETKLLKLAGRIVLEGLEPGNLTLCAKVATLNSTMDVMELRRTNKVAVRANVDTTRVAEDLAAACLTGTSGDTLMPATMTSTTLSSTDSTTALTVNFLA